MRRAYSKSESERAASSVLGRDVVASPRPCPVCGGAMPGRKTSACSDRCRAAKSRRRRRVPLRVTEVREIRDSLTAALEAVWEALAILERRQNVWILDRK
jgi:predicted nucleic acid-binding Zn ribbon protein